MGKVNVALIGYGRMGEKYLNALEASGRWNIRYICDKSPVARELAAKRAPGAIVVSDEDIVFGDSEVQAVVLCALADSRLEQIRKAVSSGKHILSEKPIAAALQDEETVVKLTENAPVVTAVNLYLRNSWYHHLMKEYIDEGEIGELAIIRVCHMTPGLAPGEGHEYEGPPFHDCGMHYVDIARWYAGAEYRTWNSQALRMWDWKDPWWLQSHGTFDNGVVFDITQGFVYGQMSKVQTHNSYIDIIGTEGIVRMTHDFKTAVVDLRGVTRTERVEKPFGGKNLDVLTSRFADAVEKGVQDARLPRMKDAFIASKVSWAMIDDAWKHEMPSIGDNETLERIRERRRNMTDGYGLLPNR